MAESDFAGHPNIGTAFALAETGELGGEDVPESICFEEKAGLVPIKILQNPNSPRQFELKAPETLTARPFKVVSTSADSLSLNWDQIIEKSHPPSSAPVVLPFLIVEVQDTSALAEIQVNLESFNNLLNQGSPPYIFVYTQNTSQTDMQARMFAPLDGITEDPPQAVPTAPSRHYWHNTPNDPMEISLGRCFKGSRWGAPSDFASGRKRKRPGNRELGRRQLHHGGGRFYRIPVNREPKIYQSPVAPA